MKYGDNFNLFRVCLPQKFIMRNSLNSTWFTSSTDFSMTAWQHVLSLYVRYFKYDLTFQFHKKSASLRCSMRLPTTFILKNVNIIFPNNNRLIEINRIFEKKTPSINLWIITFFIDTSKMLAKFLNKSCVNGLDGLTSSSIPIAIAWASKPPIIIGSFLFPLTSLSIKA